MSDSESDSGSSSSVAATTTPVAAHQQYARPAVPNNIFSDDDSDDSSSLSDASSVSSSSSEEDELEPHHNASGSFSHPSAMPTTQNAYHPARSSAYEESDLEDEDEPIEDEDEDESSENSFSKKPSKSAKGGKATAGKGHQSKSKGSSAGSKSKAGPRKTSGAAAKQQQEEEQGGYVPEPVSIAMGDKSSIDKFLSWRRNDEGVEELLVKYKNMSYIHAEWVPRTVVEADRLGKMRVIKFVNKPLWETHYSEDEPFNPAFLLVDRVIDEGEMGHELYYLVKWCSQTYDLCTWEPAELVEKLDGSKIDEFHKRRILDATKTLSFANAGKRPNPREWAKLEESPTYKNDNTLRPYQLEGLNWLLFCILADEMGLGKTVQSTVFLDYIYRRCNVKGPFLIVTPLSTIGNWEREIRNWTDLNVVVYHGKDTARNLIVDTEFCYRDVTNKKIKNIYKFDVILTTYEMAIAGSSHLRPVSWRCVVVDEAHRLKNKASKISEVLKQYRMDHRVLLTGTPLQNSLDELWSLLNFLEPDKFNSEKAFQSEFGGLSSAGDVEKLQKLLKPLMLRRLKEDVEKSIPVKEETIIEVELTTMQKKWYRSILERNFTWLKQGTKKNNMPNLRNTVMELRKCCIHPFLLNGAEETILKEYSADTAEKQYSALIQASGKMVLIDKLLRKLRQGGHKVLIFSQMTKCLDLIQDYLRGQSWGFERIDGSVRGDLRQASIDRFSAPGSDTFVFLLCTRAGGVGINLTVADTVIIFDSDWNPQNDLQAQSRVHRIGQKNAVQIYRLVTRNTYEREMLDRASMKLGLDKAVLQRMEFGQDDSGSDTLSKMQANEIEDLLKKGAYGAFMDDDSSKSFCEEDIDQILMNRTRKIVHDNTNEKGSIFSKASFATSEAQVDLNDPDFWDKVAQKADLKITEMVTKQDLILLEPRARRQVQRFGILGDEADDSSGEADFKPSKSDTVKKWSSAERNRLERGLMMFGYARWDRMKEVCKGRSVDDLKACAKMLIRHSLRCNAYEPDVVTDVKHCLSLDGVTDIMAESDEVPYSGATRKQIAEFKSFFADAGKDYHDHIEKKGKNMLPRIQMMSIIRDKIRPEDDKFELPEVLGAPPTVWWGLEEDRDLLRGTLRYGYQQYNLIASDPTLCFAKRLGLPLAVDNRMDDGDAMAQGDDQMDIEGSTTNGGDGDMDFPSEADVGEVNVKNEGVDVKMENADQSKIDSGSTPSQGNGTASSYVPVVGAVKMEGVINGGDQQREIAIPVIVEPPGVQVKKEKDVKPAVQTTDEEGQERESYVDNDSDDEAENIEPGGSAQGGDGTPGDSPMKNGEPGQEVFPSPSECGTRIRRIIAAYVKMQQNLAKLEAKRLQQEEKMRARIEKEEERIKLKERELTKKDKLDTDPRHTDRRDWSRFKIISLLRKSDDILEEYFVKLISAAQDILYPDPAKPSTPDRDIDGLTTDKAKKILKRVEAMKKLREQVLPHPHIDQNIQILRKYGRAGLPEWWTTEHDKAYLLGAAKWGLNRGDLYVEDDTLPFKALYEQYIQEMSKNPDYVVAPGRFDDRFWMKEAIAMKRFYSLCDAVLNPVSRRGGRRSEIPAHALPAPVTGTSNGRKRPGAEEDDEASEAEKVIEPPTKRSRTSRSKRESNVAVVTPVKEEEVAHRKKRRSGDKEKDKEREKSSKKKRDRSSGEDTDTMLGQELSAKKKKKRKKKHHSELVGHGDDLQASGEGHGSSSHVKKKKKHKKSSSGDVDGGSSKKSKKKKKKHRGTEELP
ncbi:choline dehydrogenase 7 [Blyttiomyces sp. JEL0837]|nr:choline dehydrogenase 7 [Blyttiomyces sp. JEL0837]